MTLSIVDTNVAMAANGIDTPADELCQETCIEKLQEIVVGERIALDEGGLILDEYAKRLSHAGAPGVGDMFFKYAFNNQYIEEKCELVAIDPVSDAAGTFAQFPMIAALAGFHRKDRKFVAVAAAASEDAVIFNATDSDWTIFGGPLSAAGIVVSELCCHVIAQKVGQSNDQG